MKKVIMVSILVLGYTLSALSQANQLLSPAGVAPLNVNVNDPNFGLTILQNTNQVNSQNWRGGVKLLGSTALTGNVNGGGTLFWDRSGVQNVANGQLAQNHFFIAGPSQSPIGDYWMGLQNGYGNTVQPIEFFQIYGQNRAGEPNAGSVRLRFDTYVNGSLGIGLPTALTTEQLHTTQGVRFEGLISSNKINNLVGIDANGKLWRAPLSTGGVQSNCLTTNFLTKTTSANTIGCSQIYDDGSFVGVSTTTPFVVNGTASKLNVNGLTVTNSLYVISDEKFKTNISPIGNATEIVNKLNPVTYDWNTEKFKDKNFESSKQSGFIAQQLEKIYPAAVAHDNNNNYVVNYNALIPILTRAQQETNSILTVLKMKNDELEKELEILKNKIKYNSDIEINNAKNTDYELSQNKPNPFSNSTIVEYKINKNYTSAYIAILDLSGKELKRYVIGNMKMGTITIKDLNISNGVYLYALIVDNELSATQKMVFSK